jgi:phage repressor protein C with HTH and peptisase S24 domain
MKPPIENIEAIREAKNLSRETVADKLGINLSTYGKIERGETGLTIDRLYDLAVIFKMQPEEILTYNKPKRGNVTYIPIEAQAGFLAGHSQEYAEYKTYSIPFLEGNKKLFMINATGDSMFPTIVHGDHIIVEEIADIKSLKYGKPYVIVAKEGCVIKRIHSHENQKKFLLKSDNPTYEPYDIDKREIISVWLVQNYKLSNLAIINPFLFVENVNQQYKGNQK